MSGCATALTPQQAQAAARADPLSQKQAEARVHQYIAQAFKDPGSVQNLQIGTPRMSRVGTNRTEWLIPFTCNAKNSFGGYVGNQLTIVPVRFGQIDWNVAAYPNLYELQSAYEGRLQRFLDKNDPGAFRHTADYPYQDLDHSEADYGPNGSAVEASGAKGPVMGISEHIG